MKNNIQVRQRVNGEYQKQADRLDSSFQELNQKESEIFDQFNAAKKIQDKAERIKVKSNLLSYLREIKRKKLEVKKEFIKLRKEHGRSVYNKEYILDL